MKPETPSEFTQAVVKMILKIPKGKVATYKQIAELVGRPGAVRGVAWILHSSSRKYKLPWHRVLNAKGKIAFDKRATNYRKQRLLLQQEGVEFKSADELSLPKYQWKKKPRQKRTARPTPRMFS